MDGGDFELGKIEKEMGLEEKRIRGMLSLKCFFLGGDVY